MPAREEADENSGSVLNCGRVNYRYRLRLRSSDAWEFVVVEAVLQGYVHEYPGRPPDLSADEL